MIKTLFLSFFTLLLYSCQSPKVDNENQLKQLELSIDRSWPNLHTDSLFLPGKDILAEQLTKAFEWKNRLENIPEKQLTPKQKLRKDSLLNICHQTIDQLSTQQIHRWRASLYDVGPTLLSLYTNNPDSLLSAIKKVPVYYKIARHNLDSVNLDEINQSIRFNIATFRWLKQMEQQKQYEAPMYHARIAIKDYLAWCNSLVFEYYDTQME